MPVVEHWLNGSTTRDRSTYNNTTTNDDDDNNNNNNNDDNNNEDDDLFHATEQIFKVISDLNKQVNHGYDLEDCF